jgi:hypothetical protein
VTASKRIPPGVGAEIPRGREALCGYSPGPEGELCPDDAEVHVFVTSGARGLVALSACTQHAPIARVAGRFVDEHPFTAACADQTCPEPGKRRPAESHVDVAESHSEHGGESR